MDRFCRPLAAGDILFREGDPGSCAYLLESGELEIFRETAAGHYVLARVGPGELVGEMALISAQPRVAGARAVSDCQLRLLTHEHLDEKLSQADPLLRHLLNMIIGRYSGVLDRLSARGEAPPIPAGPGGAAERQDHAYAVERIQSEHSLELALENGELCLYYQPIISLHEERLSGFEALLRWQRPGHGLVAPDLFIPLAEESSIIERIGRWIAGQACDDLSRMLTACRRSGQPDLTVSINVAARQLGDERLLPTVRDGLRRHRLPPSSLRLEITESQLLTNWDLALALLNQARAMGLRLALDDFGAGHSSLAYLHRLPVDTLKIDRLFLAQFDSDPASRHIIGAIASLARALGLVTIIEGVETRSQLPVLAGLGVDYVQGFVHSRPLPADEALALID